MTGQDLSTLGAVAIGGACGALARYGIALAAAMYVPRFSPLGTLVANLVGCLLIGVAMQAAQQHSLTDLQRQLIVTGFLGALTTFSTFGFQTIELLREQRYGAALGNVLANLLLGLAAVAVGLWLARRWQG